MTKASDIEALPAFPLADQSVDDWAQGMTLRDYFAGRAMGALRFTPDRLGLTSNDELVEEGARLAYAWADAMIRARKEP